MTEPKKAEVTLATKHVHGGREYDRGDVLTLFAATRELELDGWL